MEKVLGGAVHRCPPSDALGRAGRPRSLNARACAHEAHPHTTGAVQGPRPDEMPDTAKAPAVLPGPSPR
ncbi:hypothetical protein FM125_00685 [Micrococcus lylae]|uniref:Uncharacterized protein n=1 Tax=Micrococcus lylae TaxID=1273 RepID=A0A1R4I8E0_9MICC|nr:hypothetical protein FM125_00685 [Micrococcus lylae]